MMTSLLRISFFMLIPGLMLAQTAASNPPAYRITVNGVVVNSDGHPLMGAEISTGELRAITADNGEFTLAGIAGGDVALVVRRIGYQPGLLEFKSDSTLKTISVLARLAPTVVALGTIVVEGQRRNLHLHKNGYYTRKTLGRGYFFDEERLGRAARLNHVVSEAPGIWIEHSGGRAIPMARSGTSMRGPRYCVMPIMLDGFYVAWASDMNEIAEPESLAGMEVYGANNIPPRIAGQVPPDKQCGLIVLWSKGVAQNTAKN